MEEDRELLSISQVNAALKVLSEEERYRVMQWAANKYLQNATPLKFAGPTAPAAITPTATLDADTAMTGDEGADTELNEIPVYDTFAEMLDASGADTDAERFLVAAFWLQITNERADWKSFEINKLLKDTGKQIGTINNAVRALTKKSKTKPALVVQVSKNASSSGQGSKVLKLTSEGVKKTKAMLGLT